MFTNNLNGDKNKIKIKQNYNVKNNSKIIVEIILGIFVAVIAGIILHMIYGG